MSKVYLTTAIPYMNGRPHIGHALDYLLADVCTRYHKKLGDEVRFQVGMDEHGSKIAKKAEESNLTPQEFVDQNSDVFLDFFSKLGVEYTDIIRTSEDYHQKRCQKIWEKLAEHIYMAKYEGWYCDGCERFVTSKEYEECKGICPDHQKPYTKLEEENYYFRVSDFKDQIRDAIVSDELHILPEFRKKEILRLLEDTPDVSVSRPISQLRWGVPVPGDSDQVMYVWIDALSNYLTVLGYPDKKISDWWPARAQFLGKDILRFHAIIWPAMLLGLGLPLPKNIITHGFILSNEQKMSKSVGNVVNPFEVINKYGTDAFRYYFLRHIDTFVDSSFSWQQYDEAYNNELANDLGNLVQRLATLAKKNNLNTDGIVASEKFSKNYLELMDGFEFSKAFDYIWVNIQSINRRIDQEKPWVLAKNGEKEKLEECLVNLINELLQTVYELEPFLPSTCEKIYNVFCNGVIAPLDTPLFPKS